MKGKEVKSFILIIVAFILVVAANYYLFFQKQVYPAVVLGCMSYGLLLQIKKESDDQGRGES